MSNHANLKQDEHSFTDLFGDDVVRLKGDKVAEIRQAFAPTLAQKERQKAAAAQCAPRTWGRRRHLCHDKEKYGC